MTLCTMINVNSIVSHENNPRTQLGDLSELVQSIKANGILQYLTVIPDGDKYKCVIGHRRLAAAKKAGLTEVPCVIKNFDEKQQIATMMMENMHRSNLSAREEALGFQMMFDLGENADAVSKRTGFSKTTIAHRTKMLKLDADKMKAAEERGATLGDYIKLEKIRDIETRNKVLDSVGTNNFEAQLNKAIQEQEKMDRLKKIEDTIKTFAKKIEKYGEVDGETVEMYCLCSYYDWDKKEVEIPEDGEYFYVVGSGISVYKAGTRPEYVEPEEKRLAREEQERVDTSIIEMARSCQKLRIDFAEKIPTKKYAAEIRAFYMDMSLEYMDKRPYAECRWSEYFEGYKENPEKTMLDAAMMVSHILNTSTFHSSWSDGHRVYSFEPNELLERVYGHLENMGYVCSDLEMYYREGEYADILQIPDKYLVKNSEENP